MKMKMFELIQFDSIWMDGWMDGWTWTKEEYSRNEIHLPLDTDTDTDTDTDIDYMQTQATQGRRGRRG